VKNTLINKIMFLKIISKVAFEFNLKSKDLNKPDNKKAKNACAIACFIIYRETSLNPNEIAYIFNIDITTVKRNIEYISILDSQKGKDFELILIKEKVLNNFDN